MLRAGSSCSDVTSEKTLSPMPSGFVDAKPSLQEPRQGSAFMPLLMLPPAGCWLGATCLCHYGCRQSHERCDVNTNM